MTNRHRKHYIVTAKSRCAHCCGRVRIALTTTVLFAFTLSEICGAQYVDTIAVFDGMFSYQTRFSDVAKESFLFLANEGLFLTEDSFETFHDVIDRETLVLALDGAGTRVDYTTGTVYLVTPEKFNTAAWRVYRSLDHGQSFQLMVKSIDRGLPNVIDSPGFEWWAPSRAVVDRDSWLRIFDACYNPFDSVWYSYETGDCIKYGDSRAINPGSYIGVGIGVYEALNVREKKWKRMDYINQTCVESPVPDAADRLMTTQSGVLYALDYAVKWPVTVPQIWRKDADSDKYRLLDTIVTDRGVVTDTLTELSPYSVGNYTLLVDRYQGRVLIIDSSDIREVNLKDWRDCLFTYPDQISLSAYSAADSSILLSAYSGTCGSRLAKFSLVTGEIVEEGTPLNYSLGLDLTWLTPKGIVVPNAGGSFVLRNMHTGVRTRVGRYVGTDSSVRRPIAFCESAYLGDTLCSVDQFGFINQIQSADSCVLPYFIDDNSVDFALRERSAIPFTLGLPRLAPLKWALASLGPSFKVLYNRTTFTEKQKDTVTAALQRSDGSWLLGYRSLFATSDSGTIRTLVSSPSDSVSAISGIMETGSGGLLVSRRGYNLRGRGPEPVDVVGGLWLQLKPEAPWQQVGTDLVETEGIGPMVLSITRNPLDSSIWASNCWVSVVAQFAQINNGDSSFHYSGSVYDYCLHRSTDGGVSWQLMARVDDNWNYAPTTGSVSFSSTGKIAWTLHDRVMISSDGGMQWQSTQDQGILGIPICSAMFDRQDNLVIGSRNGLFSIPTNAVSVHEETATSEQSRILVTTQPNPANGSFTVSLYNLDHLLGAMQRLHIVDVAGRVIADITSLVAGNYSSGRVDVPVALGRIPSGVYMLIGTDGHHTFTHPFVVVME